MSNFINHKYLKKDKVQKRLYQELLTFKAIENSSLVVAPTGLGKTIVAVLLIAYTYNPNKSIIFLAPTKPLVEQHKKSLLDVLDIDSENIFLLTGYTKKEIRKEIYKKKGIIICATPQTINNDLNSGFLNKNNYNLLIFDEAHRGIGDYAYVNISNFFDNDIKRLGLTASPGHNKQKIKEIADNLKINHIEIKTEQDIDVKDYIKDREIDKVFINLDPLSKEISYYLNEFIESKIKFLRKLNFKITKNYTKKQIIQIQAQIFQRLNKSKENILFLALSFTSSILKAYHAKELIETQSHIAFKKYYQRLIIDSKSKNAPKAINLFLKSEQVKSINYILAKKDLDSEKYPKQEKLKELIIDFVKLKPKSKILVFNNFRENANHLVDILNKSKEIKSKRFVGQKSTTKDKGLSQKEQINLIKEFRENKYNTLVCTSVGEEGLDIPSVDLVIFYDAVASEIRSIQRKGRTGRFNAGRVIILINKDTIDEHYYYVSLKKEQRMKNTLKNFNLKKPQKKQKTIFDY